MTKRVHGRWWGDSGGIGDVAGRMTYQTSALERAAQQAMRQSGMWRAAAAQEHRDADAILPRQWLLLAIGGSAAVVGGLMWRSRLGLAWHCGSFAAVLGVFGALAILRFYAGRAAGGRRGCTSARLRDFSEYLAMLLGLGLVGGVASYAAASDTHGFTDMLLAGLDARLHFHWLAWYETVLAHPWLQGAGAAAYNSIYVSPIVLLGAYAWAGEVVKARAFLLSFWLGATMTLLLFPLFPAKGALEYFWHGPIPYMPTNGLFQGAIIPALRAHDFGAVDLGAMRGLVCAPSFHTVCATLFLAAALPMARLRWGLVPLNLAMLLATPVEGTHYLTDMVLGLMVALVALGAVRSLQLYRSA